MSGRTSAACGSRAGQVASARRDRHNVGVHHSRPSPDDAIRFRMGIDIGDAIATAPTCTGTVLSSPRGLQAECSPSSVPRAERIRISAQLLIDALGGHQLWTQRYDRELVDAFSIRDQIAAAVANAIPSGGWRCQATARAAYSIRQLSAWGAINADCCISGR